MEDTRRTRTEGIRVWDHYHQQNENCSYATALEGNIVFIQDMQQQHHQQSRYIHHVNSFRLYSTSTTQPSAGGKRFSSTSVSTAVASPPSQPPVPTPGAGSSGFTESATFSSTSSAWNFPQTSGKSARRTRASHHYGPLPLPISLKTFRPQFVKPTSTPSTLLSLHGGVPTTAIPQQSIPPPPAVLGSQPLYYLARKFPILAEHELKAIPNKTALDYSSFLVGAMTTSYPSATTLRAVVRQFRKFLKASAQQVKAEVSSRTKSGNGSSSSRSRHSIKIELPRARIWAQTIRGLIWLKQYRRARVAIHAMQKLGIRPTGFAWRGICRGWIEQGELARAEALAVKVFTRPEISHDYKMEERPYYFTDMQLSGENEAGAEATSNGSRPASGTAARRKHRSPMSPNSAPLFLVIEALAECGEMERARHWFDQIPEHEMTDLLTSDMVAGYLKIGQQDKAQEVIRIMARCGVKPTAIVFNPIVEHAVRHMNMEAAEELVQDMTRLGIYSNLFTYKILIQGYIAAGQKDKALECLDRIKASGVETDRALGRILLDGLWQLGELREGDQGPIAICNTNRGEQDSIQGDLRMAALDFVDEPGWSQRCIDWIKDGKFEQAEEVLHHVLSLEIAGVPSIQAEAVQVVRALAARQDMTRARHWFDQLIRPERVAVLRGATSLGDNAGLNELMDHMVSGYIKSHRPTDAEAVISIMSQQGVYPTVDTINLILRWSTLQAEMEDAEGLVQKMALSGIPPNQETFEILCQGYASRGALVPLQECLTRMEEAGFAGLCGASPLVDELREHMLGQGTAQEPARQSPLPSGSVFATMCAQWIDQDQMSRAEQFVGHLLSNPHVQPEMVPYSTLIEGWISQSQRNPVSISALQAMNSSGSGSGAKARGNTRFKDSDASTNPSSSSVPSSKSLHHEIQLCEENVSKMRKARYWFDRTPDEFRTVDLLNKMVGGYMALGLEQESEAVIQWMAARKIKPNVVTYNHILEHTIQHLTMPTAEGLVHKMQKGGIAPSVETWNLLVRGYVIRGQLGKALECLDRMAENKIVVPSSFSSSSSLSVEAKGIVNAGGKSKTREIIEAYDREILDVVVHTEEVHSTSGTATTDTDPLVQEVITPNDSIHHTYNDTSQQQQQQQQQDDATALPSQKITTTQAQRSNSTTKSAIRGEGVEPNALTKQLILSGFGPELKPPQGQGDYARALELYRNRVARQKEQEDQLLQGLASLRMAGEVEVEDDEDEWILDHLESFQELSSSSSDGVVSGGGGVGMTDVDWKNELKWEELMEMEKGRERELSGRTWLSLSS
ncbi:hypothetical protein BG015_001317 [Linnemannia schmuckeri]|uniref:Pentacotripeptide-repeat region of PRORP domain-containing protein n=1 Tax=Linnemannia schmuckeri TaxID=64567 RepID=A0A9P5RS00_9FUNG|nr:hypothetical protein BG015_001317 [Linnemannia schmuckeri]